MMKIYSKNSLNFLKSPKGIVKKQTGFAITWLIFLLPIILTIAFFLFRTLGWQAIEREVQSICETRLAETQKQTGTIIEKLLSLNKLIRAAKLMKNTGYALMAAGAASYNAALVEQGRQLVSNANTSLRNLKLIQKSLLSMGQNLMRLKLYQTKFEISKIAQKKIGLQSETLHSQNFKERISSYGKLAVRPISDSTEYPEYELEQAFSRLQTMALSWQLNSKQEASSWKSPAIKIMKSCGATLIENPKKQQSFLVRLIPDKSY